MTGRGRGVSVGQRSKGESRHARSTKPGHVLVHTAVGRDTTAEIGVRRCRIGSTAGNAGGGRACGALATTNSNRRRHGHRGSGRGARRGVDRSWELGTGRLNAGLEARHLGGESADMGE